MKQISNAERQARFRKKENLKHNANKIFDLWVRSPMRFRYSKRTEEEVRHALDQAIALPSDWKEKDYEHAEKKLGQYHLDLISSVDQIANDVNGDWASDLAKFRTTPDPAKLIANHKETTANAWALASHIISALKLSKCNDAAQAAALMEAVRFVGRSLVSSREIHCSQATAMCLASTSPAFQRPEWFVKKLAEAIRQQIGESLAREVGEHLSKSFDQTI